jgi:P-type Cu+ transporter
MGVQEQKIHWKVGNLHCTSCAGTVTKFLTKNNMQEVSVNFATGDVFFVNTPHADLLKLKNDLQQIGYTAKDFKTEPATENNDNHLHAHDSHFKKLFLYTLPFTAILMLHMLPVKALAFLHNGYVQLVLATPVYIIGMRYFAVSAFKGLRNGAANMNLLITIGASAAYVYSLLGLVLHYNNAHKQHEFLFFETTASIITLVFLGNWLEDITGKKTQEALGGLLKNTKRIAHMIAFDDNYKEQLFDVDAIHLKTGDLIQINTGEEVPADCKILSGEAWIDESLLTGESTPLLKKKKDILVGGSINQDGMVKAQVTANIKEGALQSIMDAMLKAQQEKPPLQQLADKISNIFIPIVLVLAALTFVINYFWYNEVTTALMRSIAVLVVACPCAMGLATPAAIAVGLGRGLKEGILFKKASALEYLKKIRHIIFDKTGTLTKGEMVVTNTRYINITEHEAKAIFGGLEKNSNHPIAKAVALYTKDTAPWVLHNIKEVKGEGIYGNDSNGNLYGAVNYNAVKLITNDNAHSVYLLKNGALIGYVDIADDVRTETPAVLNKLTKMHVTTAILSGDNTITVNAFAQKLNIKEAYAEQKPHEKLVIIEQKNIQSPVAYVGDGINDGPALSKASVGISMNSASQLAISAADIILMKGGLTLLPKAIKLGIATQNTIISNLYWALGYNVIFIPIAAIGWLHPTWAALIMAGSDVILAANSIYLRYKKLD